MVVKLDEVKKIRFFEGYSEKHFKKIAEISTVKEFKVKEIIFEQYDELKDLYVLLEGYLSMGISVAREKRIHLGSIHEGSLFSWSAVFPPYISTAWVMACSPVKVMAIDAKKLQAEFGKDCEFGFKFMEKIAKTISQRLQDTRFHLMNRLTV